MASRLPRISSASERITTTSVDPRATAYLLAAYRHGSPKTTVFVCVVDPGVGSHSHVPVVVQVNEQWFVGPGNGIFNAVMKHGRSGRAWTITWRPEPISSTFHGRESDHEQDQLPSLLSNAVVRNTLQIERIVTNLRTSGMPYP